MAFFPLYRPVINYGECGGYKTGGGGKSSFKKGGRKGFSHVEGGRGTQHFEVVLSQKLEVLAMLSGGGARKFTPFPIN